MIITGLKMNHRSLMVLLVAIVVVLALAPLLLRSLVLMRYAPRIVEELPPDGGYRTAIVFGAAVRQEQPTTVLRDRLDTAIRLYQLGQVDRLIMSGDGRTADYNEPATMARYAQIHGVPPEAIIIDHQGLRTYETCYRARFVFGLERVVLITQNFHLPRALFTCDLLGIDAVGVPADQRVYSNARWYDLRELLALPVAAWDGILHRIADTVSS